MQSQPTVWDGSYSPRAVLTWSLNQIGYKIAYVSHLPKMGVRTHQPVMYDGGKGGVSIPKSRPFTNQIPKSRHQNLLIPKSRDCYFQKSRNSKFSGPKFPKSRF